MGNDPHTLETEAARVARINRDLIKSCSQPAPSYIPLARGIGLYTHVAGPVIQPRNPHSQWASKPDNRVALLPLGGPHKIVASKIRVPPSKEVAALFKELRDAVQAEEKIWDDMKTAAVARKAKVEEAYTMSFDALRKKYGDVHAPAPVPAPVPVLATESASGSAPTQTPGPKSTPGPATASRPAQAHAQTPIPVSGKTKASASVPASAPARAKTTASATAPISTPVSAPVAALVAAPTPAPARKEKAKSTIIVPVSTPVTESARPNSDQAQLAKRRRSEATDDAGGEASKKRRVSFSGLSTDSRRHNNGVSAGRREGDSWRPTSESRTSRWPDSYRPPSRRW